MLYVVNSNICYNSMYKEKGWRMAIALSDELREDLVTGLMSSREWTRDRLIQAILTAPGMIERELKSWSNVDLVEEVVDIIEENYDGKTLKVDSGAKFTININELIREETLVTAQDRIVEHNDLIKMATIAAEGSSVPQIIAHYDEMAKKAGGSETFKRDEVGLIPNPFTMPGGSVVSIGPRGAVDVISARGVSAEEIKEGFENASEHIYDARKQALQQLAASRDVELERNDEPSMGM